MKKQACLILALLGSASGAIAQTTANIPPSFGAAPRASSGAPTRQVGIYAAVDATYDSNVFGVGRGFVGTQGRDLDDVRLTPSLRLNIVQPLGRQSAFLAGSIGYDFYARNSELNRERIDVQGGYNLVFLNACGATITSGYNRSRINPGDVFAVTVDPARTRNNVQEVRSVGVQANCARAIGFSPTAGYTHVEQRNSGLLFQPNDVDQDVFDASIGYARPSLGRIAIYGTYATATYIRRNRFGFPAIGNEPRDGVVTKSAGIRFERDIGSRASGAIAIGYSWVDPRSFVSDKFRGSNYSLTLATRPSDRLTVDFAATRSVDLSNSLFATYSITDVYAVNGTYRVRRPLAVNFGASYQSRDFRGTAQVPGGNIPLFAQSDNFTRAYGGFNYDLNRRLRLTGLVSQQRRDSNFDLFDYNNTTVSLGISFALSQ